MGCWGRYYRQGGYQGAPWQTVRHRGRDGKAGAPAATNARQPSSGNRAFDEYRAETLRRLEDEQKEFAAFLDRLRFAKDKAEFDQFMTEVRQRPPAPPPEQPQPPHGQG